MVKKISEKEFSQVEAQELAVVDFSATWCGPCKMVAPVLEEISEEEPGIAFFNIDVDENPGLAQKYGIMSIPAIGVFKKGEIAEMQVGFRPKEQLQEFIKSHQ